MDGRFRFGDFELDLFAYVLRYRGERVKVERIPMELLSLLVANAGRLVDRSEIQATVWGRGVFFERDAAINTAARKVRQALGDDLEQPRFIETVVRKGYKFIAPVERLSQKTTSAVAGPGPSSARWRRNFPSYSVTRGKKEFMLDGGENLIGRDPAARVFVDHAAVSRRHASITVDAKQVLLEDLKSRNGTFLNGRKVDAPTPLQHGAVIGVGPITLTFVALSTPGSTATLSSGSARLSKRAKK